MSPAARGDGAGTTVDPRRNPHALPALVAEVAARSGWREAAAVIQGNWDAFASEAPQQLLDALKALPGEAFVETPGLVVAANYLQHVTIDGDPRRFFHDDRLARPPGEHRTADLNSLILLTAEAAGARTAGRLDQARRIAEQAREALATLRSADRAPIASSIPHLRFQWGRTLDSADAPGALSEYEEAHQLARLTAQPVIARRAAGHIAWFHAERGRLRLADLWLARAHAEPATKGRYDVVVFLASALLKHDREDPGAPLDLARALGLPLGEHWAAALWMAAMIERTKPGASSVHARLELELDRHPEARALTGANGRYLKAARARIARLRPRLQETPVLPDSPTALDRLLAATASHGRGDHAAALMHSDAAVAMTAAPRVEAPASLIAAASHLALGHLGTAADAFRVANRIIADERMLSAYTFVPAATARALADLAGEPLHSATVAAGSARAVPRLTKREHEILELLTTGRSMAQIAADLYISPNTLKSTVRTLYRKLGVTSRAAAADVARHAYDGS
ncbi:LuxR C-terminal-related transcriptional regulator [uncultured Leifsonia sp.]|uniref:LuxR C-terminal-related transcriptional regulator n=1 Tax=uncultured Leifsonia sp. TaxID=340359 RepID=UPI0028D347F9|nr:LuxR C-terminal-related transcriptional regulator [uncultured Leifsonia sp.]